MLFAMGLSANNYAWCLLGRFIFGLSDSMTIFQHTILCYWFDNNNLPFAFGIVLFLVKVVRAANDNFASMFYNATDSLSAFFWVGFALSIVSFVSGYYLTGIHEAVVEAS